MRGSPYQLVLPDPASASPLAECKWREGSTVNPKLGLVPVYKDLVLKLLALLLLPYQLTAH